MYGKIRVDLLYIYLTEPMNSQTGSRFSTSNQYPQAPYFSQSQPTEAASNITPNLSTTQNPYSSYPAGNPQNQSQQYYSPPPPAMNPQRNVENLLAMYTPEERIKVKSENYQKYKMNPESFIYQLNPGFLDFFVRKYPQDFSSQLRDDISKNMGKMRRDLGRFRKLLLGGLLYWVALRKRTWFRLTGNPIMRISWGFICVNNIIDLSFDIDQYLVQASFIHNQQYEKCLEKHNINQTTIYSASAELIS